jgi:UDP-glucose 4-epimerase
LTADRESTLPRRVLITGGAGFIGSHLVDGLLARGVEATVLDDLSTGRIENLLRALDAGAELCEGSVADPAAVAQALELARADTVLHLAAQSDVGRAAHDPACDALTNVIGTVTVLEAARRAGVDRVVLASADGAIYGDAAVVPTPESAPPRPLSPYAESKIAAEGYAELYHRLHGLSTFILRLANVYGPRQAAGLVAIFCAAALDGGAATVYGDGSQTRDFIYVEDVVDAFIAAACSRACGCCNVATGRESSVLDLVWMLALQPRFAPERAGEVRRSCLEPATAERVLGWYARIGLEEGLQRTLAATGTAAEAL